jgi:hypothetical protein
LALALASALLAGGCSDAATLFSPAFVNTVSGGYVPVTPGPNAPFILVRVVNETGQNAEFVVTVEKRIIEVDEDGNFLFDENNEPVTRIVRETHRVATSPTAPANDLGLLFSCARFPITRIGLGENLLDTDTAVSVGGGGAGGAAGVSVEVGDLNPLVLEGVGNFNCGDTVIFRAFQSVGVPGGVGLQSFLLPGSEQPTNFSGPSTFENLAGFLESQLQEELP